MTATEAVGPFDGLYAKRSDFVNANKDSLTEHKKIVARLFTALAAESRVGTLPRREISQERSYRVEFEQDRIELTIELDELGRVGHYRLVVTSNNRSQCVREVKPTRESLIDAFWETLAGRHSSSFDGIPIL